MEEEISIIDSKAREERIRNFLKKNKNKIIIFLSIIVLIVFSFFAYDEYKDRKRIKIAENYNLATINFNTSKENSKNELVNIINQRDAIYSPLALYFLIDNDIINSKEEVNKYFDIIINEVKLEKEIKNLIIYKKGLFNSDYDNENYLLKILEPIIKSNSIWKSHALYLLAEYFLHNNQKQKAKEFYEQVITLSNSNNNILSEVQKRLQSEYSE
jgi:predicted negative regulator of RcsB-dependent stress response